MNRFLTTGIFVALLCTGQIMGQQSPWQVISPNPTYQMLNGLTVLNADTVYAVGGMGTIIMSQNGGKTWAVQQAIQGDTDLLYDVQFITNQTGFACGDDGLVFKTTDGGVSWRPLDFVFDNSISALYFVSPSVGWVCGSQGILFKTTDGGTSWIRESGNGTRDLFGIQFLNSQTGFCIGVHGTLLRTTDGGTNWLNVSPDSIRNLFSCSFPSAAEGWVSTSDTVIYHTTNGGTSWDKERSPFGYLYSIYFLNSTFGWAAGYSGTILRTNNGGKTWTSVLDNLSDDLYGIRFANAATGWAVGDNGRILFSSDSGKSWTLQSSGSMEDFESTWFTSIDHAWGVGDTGIIMRTTNGGFTWTHQPSNTDQPLHAVAFGNDNLGIAVGDSGYILRTTDGGTSWNRKNTGTDVSLYGVTFFPPDSLFWTVGDESTIFRSTTKGSSWVDQSESFPVTLENVKMLNSSTGFAVGDNGTVLKSTNSGSSWVPKSTGVSWSLYCIDITSDNTIYAAGDYSTIIKSTDLGETWQDISINTYSSLYGIAFISPTTGWVVGDDGEIDETTDGGATWISQSLPISSTFRNIQVVRSSSGTAVLASGSSSFLINVVYAGRQAVQWKGSVDTSWFNPLNWNPAQVPGSFDSVYIPSGVPSPYLGGVKQQVPLAALVVAAGATLNIGGDIAQIVAQNSIIISGTLHCLANARTEFASGGDLLVNVSGKIIGGHPTFVAFGSGELQGVFPSLVINTGAVMTSAGNISASSLQFQSTLNLRSTDTLSILGTSGVDFIGNGVIHGGAVKRRMAQGSLDYYRFENPLTTIQFLGLGTYPDSVLIVTQNGIKPTGQPDSQFVSELFTITAWGGSNPPVNLSLGYLDSRPSYSPDKMALFRDSSGILLNLGSTTWNDDPSNAVELDSTFLFSRWYIGRQNYHPVIPFQFFTYLLVHDAGANSDTVTWGAQLGATNGLDTTLGETALGPVPSAGTFDVRWRLSPSITTKRNIRRILVDTSINIYRCELQPGPAGYPMTISWDSTALPAGDFLMHDAATGGTKLSVNMKLQSSDSITDPSITAVDIVHRKPQFYSYNSGWSMVSYPVAPTTSAEVSFNFPNAASSVYYYSNGYTKENTLVNGRGYWVKYLRPVTLGFEGDPLTQVSIPLTKGWNMIGSLTKNIPFSALVQNPPGLISPSAHFYTYGTSYVVVDSIYGGKGYWIKASNDGTLTMTSSGGKTSASAPPPSDDLAGCSHVAVTDRTGASQSLYFGHPKNGFADDYELPPPPPVGAFDVRFSSQSMLEILPRQSGSVTLPFTIHDAAYPVTLSFSFLPAGSTMDEIRSVSIGDMDGKIMGTVTGSDSKPVILASAGKGQWMMRVSSTSTTLPREFALSQNFPNPFNPSTHIRFAMPEQGNVTLKIFNILGQEITTLVNQQEFEAGFHETIFNGSNLGSGVYFYRIAVNDPDSHRLLFTDVRKFVLVK